METFSALLALCAGNSPVPAEFPTQRPVRWTSDVFFDLCLNKRLSKQSWGQWFEMLLLSLWRHRNVGKTNGKYLVSLFCHKCTDEGCRWPGTLALYLTVLSYCFLLTHKVLSGFEQVSQKEANRGWTQSSVDMHCKDFFLVYSKY